MSRSVRLCGAPNRWDGLVCKTRTQHESGKCKRHRTVQPTAPGEWANPTGVCWCGCRRPTLRSLVARRLDGRVIYNPGDFQRYLKGHASPVWKGREHLDIADRVAKYIEKTDTCWLWTGTQGRYGYGQIKNSNGSNLAHRVMYELLVGPIPAGLTLDHLCRNPPCVNPEHLEPVTSAENSRRMHAARRKERNIA